MLNCREATKLLSDSLERRLTVRQRIGLRLHVMMCSACRAYGRQIAVLNRMFRHYVPLHDGQLGHSLSPSAKERIKQAMKDAGS